MHSLRTRHKVSALADDEAGREPSYLDAVSALARLTYSSIYIIDYTDHSFEYVSENPMFLCGHTWDEVMRMGYDFYSRHVPEADLKMLDQINNAGFDFFERLPAADKHLYHITYDFHLADEHRKTTLINHKLTPLFFTGTGKMWKAICLVSLSSNKQAGQAAIYKEGTDERWTLDLLTSLWKADIKPRLSSQEVEMLRLYARGLTISQIAKALFVSPDTVKYYRRRIFEHFGVSNILAALHAAVSNKSI